MLHLFPVLLAVWMMKSTRHEVNPTIDKTGQFSTMSMNSSDKTIGKSILFR